MASNVVETVVGAAVLVVAGGFLAYAARSTDIGGGDSYPLTAKFFQANGIASGADVRVSGVKVGTVSDLTLDEKTYEAVVELAIRTGVEIPSDSSAKIDSDGLLGGNYIAIEPGGSDYELEPGEDIEHTQGSVSIIELLGKAVHSATQ